MEKKRVLVLSLVAVRKHFFSIHTICLFLEEEKQNQALSCGGGKYVTSQLRAQRLSVMRRSLQKTLHWQTGSWMPCGKRRRAPGNHLQPSSGFSVSNPGL